MPRKARKCTKTPTKLFLSLANEISFSPQTHFYKFNTSVHGNESGLRLLVVETPWTSLLQNAIVSRSENHKKSGRAFFARKKTKQKIALNATRIFCVLHAEHVATISFATHIKNARAFQKSQNPPPAIGARCSHHTAHVALNRATFQRGLPTNSLQQNADNSTNHLFSKTNSKNSFFSDSVFALIVYIWFPIVAEIPSGMRSHITSESPYFWTTSSWE